MGFVYFIIAIAVVYFAFKASVLIGLIATLAILLYGVYTYIPAYWALKAQKAFADADFQGAKKYYKKSLATNRAKTQVRLNCAYALMRTGDYDEAEEILDEIVRTKVLKKEEMRYAAKQARCMVYYKQGRMEEAMADGMELYNDGYRNTNVYGMLGYFKLIMNDDIDEATAFCEEAYEYNSDDRDIMDNLSLCYYQKGEYEKAAELSDKILEEAPKFVEAYYHGAQIAVKLGNYKKAKELLTHTDDCRWSTMTTVSHEDIDGLNRMIDRHLS